MCQNWDSNLELHDPSTLKPWTTQPEFASVARFGWITQFWKPSTRSEDWILHWKSVHQSPRNCPLPFHTSSLGDEVIPLGSLLSYDTRHMVILILGAFWLPGGISDCHNLGWGERETPLHIPVWIPGISAHSCCAILDKLLNNSDSKGDQPREARDIADNFTLHRRDPTV